MKQHQHLRKHQGHSKIKHFSLLLIIVFAISAFYPVYNIYAALSCSVTTQSSCNTSGYTTLLRLSGSTTQPTILTNGHAELPSQSTATYDNNVVCCTAGGSAIGNNCAASNNKIFARLSAATNAHVQETSVNTYGTNACLSDTTPGDIITVGYQNSNCTGYDTTLFSMLQNNAPTNTNETVGDPLAYTRKVCATITPQILTFDIDVSLTNSETGTPYILPLGVLTTANASNSDNTTIKSIWVDLDTNATGGAVITVQSTNSSLKSASTPAHTIPSSSGTMTAGTENYGLCIGSVTQSSGGPLTKVTPFDGATCTSGHTNIVGGLNGVAQNILTTSGTIVAGRSEIRVNAENSISTPAHADYGDTLTFIVTGTF